VEGVAVSCKKYMGHTDTLLGAKRRFYLILNVVVYVVATEV
jgi:hypothetical protein